MVEDESDPQDTDVEEEMSTEIEDEEVLNQSTPSEDTSLVEKYEETILNVVGLLVVLSFGAAAYEGSMQSMMAWFVLAVVYLVYAGDYSIRDRGEESPSVKISRIVYSLTP